jgi:hypothetical protein
VCSQFRLSSNFETAFLVALYGVAETARIAPSSTYSDRDEWAHVELSFSKKEVKMALKMGDRGDPCGVPSGTGNGSMLVESSRMDAVRLVRKEKIHFTIFGGKPFFSKMSRVLLASIWSKKPDILKRIRVA